jgi:hypothetical protein
MTGRLARSVQVAKESYRVLRNNPALAIFPILSSIAAVIVSIPFLAPMALSAYASNQAHHSRVFTTLDYVLTGCLYFVNFFVVIFFNSALVACANEELSGRRATVAYGVEMAMKRLPQILGWTLVASTVGLVLKIVSDRLGFIGAIIMGLIGMVWNVAVFFVVPSLVVERLGPVDAVKTSVGMIKKTWGEYIVLDVGIGLATGLLMALSIIPFGLAIALFISNLIWLGFLAIFLGIVYIAAVAIAASSMTTIFQTALYIYCRTGEVPDGFQAASIQGAFREKPVRTAFGRRF